SPEHPYTGLDACAWGSRRLIRLRVGHRRTLIRLEHRPHRVADKESRACASGQWPDVVQQCAAGLLSTGRRTLRLVCAQSRAPVDAERTTTRGIWHGT